jgi:Ca2+-binding EF-hand superfamily protein
VFKIYDDDNSGYLDPEEMRKFIDDLRHSMYLPVSDDEIFLKITEILDTDGDGMIELLELLNNIETIYPLMTEPGKDAEMMIRGDFEEMDFDDSGFLEREELLL